MLSSFNLMIVKVMALAIVLGGGAMYFMYKDNQSKAVAIAALTSERDAARGALTQANTDLAANREVFAQQRNDVRRVTSQAAQILEEINRAAPEADGPVAPVLADALVAIGGMWDDAGYRDPAAPTERAADRATRPLPKPASPVFDEPDAAVGCVRSYEEYAY